jgi:hypothetical protein
MYTTKKIRIWCNVSNIIFLCKCLAVLVFILWVLYGCATNMGEGPVKLREYMYEGIKFVNEAGAHGNTQ